MSDERLLRLLPPELCDAEGEALTVASPWRREELARTPLSTEEELESMLATAATARDRRSWTPRPRRIAVLAEAAGRLEQRAEDFAWLIAAEGGKPLVDARVEVRRAVEGLRLCAEAVRAAAGVEVPMSLSGDSAGRLAFTTREPIGVVLAVSAFNHPLNLIVHQVGPAIAAGCPTIVKPAPDTPLSCLALVELLRSAGLPRAACQVATVDSIPLAERLATDPRLNFLSFIGSSRVGWMLRAKLAPGVRCALEHGGAAPVLVAADADLDDITPRLVRGGFYHSGQVCVSVQRVFAERSIARELAERLARQAAELIVGDPCLESTAAGPLIRPGEVDRVEGWIKSAVAGGAEALAGGARLSATEVAPTVLWSPPVDSDVQQKEIFGPVVTVTPVEDLSEGVQLANAVPFAFQAAVCTRRLDTALAAVRGLNASAVMVNDHTAFRVDWMPFAGLNQSGLGVGGIEHTFRDMQIEKLCVLRSSAL